MEDKELDKYVEVVNTRLNDIDKNKLLKSINELRTISILYGNKKYEAIAEAYSGFFYYSINEWKTAISYYENSLNIYKKKKFDFDIYLKQIYNSLGFLYQKTRNYDKAVTILYDSIKFANQKNIANSVVYNNLGLIYYEQKKYNKSLECYNMAIKIANETNEAGNNIMTYLVNIALVYIDTKKFNEAKEIYFKSLEFAKTYQDDELILASVKGLVKILINDNDFVNAKKYCQQGIELSEKNNSEIQLFDFYMFYSVLLKNENSQESRLEYLQKALLIVENNLIGKLEIVIQELQNFYQENKNYKLALKHSIHLNKLQRESFNKEREQKIHELQQELEAEHKDGLLLKEKEFSEALQSKNKELQDANDDLQQFNYGVSHDLKEPIRSIKSRLLFLNASLQNKANKDELEGLDEALQASKRLEKMLEDMHSFSKLGSDISKQEELVDLNRVLAMVQSDLQQRIKENKALIEVDELPTLPGHTNLYVQLFQNLINNAIKFQRENVQPIIQVRYEHLNGQHIIKVIDNGVGIKKENQAKVFQLFARIKESQHIEGSGVGLSIVQKIVTKLNGSISLESVFGSGTTFKIYFE